MVSSRANGKIDVILPATLPIASHLPKLKDIGSEISSFINFRITTTTTQITVVLNNEKTKQE